MDDVDVIFEGEKKSFGGHVLQSVGHAHAYTRGNVYYCCTPHVRGGRVY